MPGIAGFVNIPAGKDEISKLLEAMLNSMTYREDYALSKQVISSQKIGFGKAELGVLEKQDRPGHDPCRSIFDGEIYDTVAFAPGLWVREEQYKTLKWLNGSYAFACLDEAKEFLFLVSDKFGSKPLYYTQLKQGLAFASEIKALLKLPSVSKTPNYQAFADFYHFGFVLGDKTLFADIHLLPPASILRYDLKSNTFTIAPYWHLSDLFLTKGGPPTASMTVDDVVQRFGEAVKKRLGQIEKLGISLSGGLDSRAILAAMEEHSQGIQSYTLGLPGCQDQKLSEQLANIAKTNHTFLEIGPQYLGEFADLAETLVFLSDGLYHPHESTEKRALDFFKTAPFRIALRGHGGEIAKASLAYPVQVNAQVENCKSHEQVNSFIYKSANLGLRNFSVEELFHADLRDILQDGPRNSLNKVQAPIGKKLSPADQCIYFYVQQWIRRQVFASLAIFRTQQEVRLPYLDDAFLQSLLALSVAQRYQGEIHVHIVQRFFPAMIKVVNSNTGAPLNAGRTRLFLTDKFNAVMKRLSMPGFRHYTEFQKWQREQFRASIEKIIFDRRTFARGLYCEKGLRNVFAAHVDGRVNNAHLLGTIVGLELWFRNFVDN